MFTLRQLEFAISVAKYQHFRRAAEECNVSQSALSLGVAALEDQLGLQLFERNNKQVLITPAGLDIIERAQSILTDSHDLLHQAKFKNEPLSSSMKIVRFSTREFNQRNPQRFDHAVDVGDLL